MVTGFLINNYIEMVYSGLNVLVKVRPLASSKNALTDYASILILYYTSECIQNQ